MQECTRMHARCTHTHTHTHTNTHTHTHTHTHTPRTHARTHAHTHTHAHTCTHALCSAHRFNKVKYSAFLACCLSSSGFRGAFAGSTALPPPLTHCRLLLFHLLLCLHTRQDLSLLLLIALSLRSISTH